MCPDEALLLLRTIGYDDDLVDGLLIVVQEDAKFFARDDGDDLTGIADARHTQRASSLGEVKGEASLRVGQRTDVGIVYRLD